MLTQRGIGKVVEILQNIESINQDILSGGADPTAIQDSDADTFVKTEATLAENFIRMNTNGTERLTIDDSGLIGIGQNTPVVQLDITSSTDALGLPVGTTAQRPSNPLNGYIRYNTTLANFEGFFTSTWTSLGGVIDTLIMANYKIQQTGNNLELTLDDTLTDAAMVFKTTVDDSEADFNIVSRREDTDLDLDGQYSSLTFSYTDQTLESDIRLGGMRSHIGNVLTESVLDVGLYISDTYVKHIFLKDRQIALGDDFNFITGTREKFINPIKSVMIFSGSEIAIRVETSTATKSDIAFSMNGGDADVGDQTNNNGTRMGAININEFHIDTRKLVRLRIDQNGNVRIGDGIGAPAQDDMNDIFEIIPPTDTSVFGIVSASTGATDSTTVSTNVSRLDFAVIIDTKATTIDGGTFTSGAWQTRTLNSITQTDSLFSLASNQITIAPGTYVIGFSAPAFGVNAHQARIQDITNTTTLVTGTNSYSNSTQTSGNVSIGFGIFTAATTIVIELQHRCETTASDTGFGQANDFGGVENYGSVRIQSIGTSLDGKFMINVNGTPSWLFTQIV